jgi:hypothetical protein
MSTQATTAQAPPLQSFTKADAKRACVSYQHVAQIVNLIVNRLMQTIDVERAKAFTPSVSQTIHALHGMFNGREVSERKPLFRAHLFTAPHFGFRDRGGDQVGREESAGRLVCRRLNDLEEAEAACGRRLLLIRRADGVTQKLTSYEGHPLLDAAEALYHVARNAPDYFKNPAAAITEELLDKAVASLPVIEQDAEVMNGSGERAEMDAGDLMTDAVLKGMWTKLINAAERALIKEFDAGADPELVARKYAAKIEKLGKDIKQRRARERLRAFSSMGDDDEEATPVENGGEGDGNNNVGQDRGGNDGAAGEVHPDKVVTPTPSQPFEPQQVTEVPFSEIENLTLRRALEYAAAEIAVVPLFGVSDGVCDCSKGSECRTPGKHPLARCAPNGVKDATTNAEKITTWFEAHPNANLGIAMGGKLRLVGIDSDPRNGGDASLFDLVEAHGENWLDTHTVRTGSNGNHFLYRLPEGVEVHRGKIAPGIDVKAEGGLLVAPPSLHASGRRYEVEKNVEISLAPAWLIEELTRQPDAQPSKVIDFQESRRRSSDAGARFFSGGERNDGLRDVACGRWTHGYAEDARDLYEQLLNVRDTRCEFVPGDPPPSDAELWEMAQRTTRKFSRGELKQR